MYHTVKNQLKSFQTPSHEVLCTKISFYVVNFEDLEAPVVSQPENSGFLDHTSAVSQSYRHLTIERETVGSPSSFGFK